MTVIDYIQNVTIDCADEAWNFAEFLVYNIGLNFYSEEIYKKTDFYGNRLKRIPFFRSNDRHNILFELNLLEPPIITVLKDKVNRATEVCDVCSHCSFAEMLCNSTAAKENESQITNLSGEKEAEECNRQFRNMINDFDAWGNIDE